MSVYDSGIVCISILHPPGDDKYNERVLEYSYAICLSFSSDDNQYF